MTIKELFMGEIKKIENVKLAAAAYAVVQRADDYFWIVPASSTGKYHPACDLGEGGLARHCIMVSRVAADLCYKDNLSQHVTDLARFAGLFHDVKKCGDAAANNNSTVWEHPLLAADFLKNILLEYNVRDDDITLIVNAVASHMGRWTESEYSDVKLPAPVSGFDNLVHTADFIASRTYIGGIPEFYN